jgi:hypothetical protein
MGEIPKFVTFASKYSWVQLQPLEEECYPHNYLFTAVYRIRFEYVTAFSYLRKHATFTSKQTFCFDGADTQVCI